MINYHYERARFIDRCVVSLKCIGLVTASLISIEAWAGEPIAYQIHIERQSLPNAMWALREQTGALIFRLTDQTTLGEIMVGPVDGKLTVEEALRRLIEGTEFTCRVTNAGSYEVLRAALIRAPSMPEFPPGSVKELRVTPNVMTVDGKRIPTVHSAPAAGMSDARSLDQVGVATVGELVVYLPGQTNALPESVSGDGAQYADLRGVGPDMVTIQINGRRVPPSATSGVAFDLNNISLTAVERVEVLEDSAAAETGVRSIGGVINIELKRKYSAPTVRLVYGAAEGGAEQRQVALSTGSSGDSRLTYGVSLEYFDRGELPGDARAFSRDQNYSRYGGGDFRSPSSWPGNISSTTGALLPGLSSSFAAVPIGTADGDPQISDFQETAGRYWLDSLRRFSWIVPVARRVSLVATADYTFESSPNVRAFGEVMLVDRWTQYQFTSPTLTNALVPASNAFNPFHQPVYVSRLLLEIDPRQVTTDSRWQRVVGGVTGDIGDWNWQVSASRSEDSATRWANNALDPERLATALAASDRNEALNLFEDGPVGSPELLASLVAEPNDMGFQLTGSDITAALRGPILSLPRGAVNLLLGAQWRRDQWRQEVTASTSTVSMWHAELLVPLWGDELTAAASIRSDRFNDFGEIVTPSYALKWEPLESLQIRGSYAIGFRTPSAHELYGPSYELQVPIVDLRRGGEVRNVTAYVGSSNEIQPVSGESVALSARIKPNDSLAILAIYWRKRIDNRIMALPLSQVLEHEDAFAGHVVRDTPTPEDSAAGQPGILRSVDLTTTQVGGIDASGIDATISYRFTTSMRAELSATWMSEFSTFDVPGAPPANRIGIANPRGTIARWRGFTKFVWQNDFASASVSVRYVAPYEDMSGNRHTGRQLHSQTSTDVQGSLDLGRYFPESKMFRDLGVTAGMLNIFDTAPQYSAVGQDLGYDASLSDPRQRFAYLRIEKRF